MHENLSAIIFEYLPKIRDYLPVIKIIIAFILGAFVGSLVDTLAMRIINEGKPRIMECRVCSGKYEFFGVISALLHLKLPCKCRTCGAVRLNRSLFVELFSAAICILFVRRFNVSFAFIFALITSLFGCCTH